MPGFKAVLGALKADELRFIVDEFELRCVDRKQLATLRDAIIKSKLNPSGVLDVLSVAELRRVARSIEVPIRGRKADIIAAILDAGKIDDAGSEAKPQTARETEARAKERAVEPSGTDIAESFDTSVFRAWLQGLLNEGAVTPAGMKFGFCPACSRKHPQRWFSYQNSPKGFYFCFSGKPLIVESLSLGSAFTVHKPADYAKLNAPSEKFAEKISEIETETRSANSQVKDANVEMKISAIEEMASRNIERTFWQKITGSLGIVRSHVSENYEVSITLTPPWVYVQVSKVQDMVSKVVKDFRGE